MEETRSKEGNSWSAHRPKSNWNLCIRTEPVTVSVDTMVRVSVSDTGHLYVPKSIVGHR